MNKVFEKIIEKLDEMIHPKQLYFCKYARGGCKHLDNDDKDCMECVVENAIEIVQEVAEEYTSTEHINCSTNTSTDTSTNGWIPCSEPPENDRYVLLSFENFSVPMVGRYEEDENGGAFYVGDDDESCVSQDIFVNAWMNLPAPYQPKGE